MQGPIDIPYLIELIGESNIAYIQSVDDNLLQKFLHAGSISSSWKEDCDMREFTRTMCLFTSHSVAQLTGCNFKKRKTRKNAFALDSLYLLQKTGLIMIVVPTHIRGIFAISVGADLLYFHFESALFRFSATIFEVTEDEVIYLLTTKLNYDMQHFS